jgi:transcriptional regulator with XRE-family HTH domain
MSLRQFADKVALSAPFISDLEHGRRSTNKLPEMARVLGVSLVELHRIEERVDGDLKKWIEDNPGLVTLLRETQKYRCHCWRFHHSPSCRASNRGARP